MVGAFVPLNDLVNDVLEAQSVGHDRQGAAAVGTGIDTQGYEAKAAALFVIAVGGTTPSATYILEESNDNSVWNTVAAADLVAQGGGAGAQPAAFTAAGTKFLTYKGAKRYLRWNLSVITGTSPTVTALGEILRSGARHDPAGQTQAP